MGATEIMETMIVIRAVDAFTAPARRMAEQMGLVGAQAEALQQKLAGLRNMAMVGGAMTLVGVGMVKGLLDAANAAGDLQTAMMGVKTALKLNNDEYQKAMNMSQTLGIPTIFSAQQVGGIMATAANAGLTKSAVLDPSIMQQYVNFADVQAQGTKHEDPNSVIASAVKMTNLSQISGTKDTSEYLNQLDAALMHTTDTAAQFATNYKYYIGKAQLMGVSSSEALVDNAWLSRMGLGGGKGGMAMQDFLSRSIYGSSGKKADDAMVAAGFVKNGRSVFEDAKGAFVGIPAASKILQDFGQRFHRDAAKMSPLLQAIFGTAGQKVAIAMSTSAATTQYMNVKEQMQSTSSVNDAQEAYNQTWQGQTKQMGTTLQDIWTNFGFGVGSALTPILTNFNVFLGKVLEFEQAHPEIMKYIATFTSIAAAVLLVVGPITLLAGVIGYLSTANMFSVGFKLMGAALGGLFNPIGLVVTAIIGLGAGLVYLWNTNAQFRAQVSAAWKAIQTDALMIFNGVKNVASSSWNAIESTFTTTWNAIKLAFTTGWNSIKSTFAAVGSWLVAHWKTIVTVILLAMGPIGWGIIALVHVIRENWEAIKTHTAIIWTAIKTFFGTAWNDISDIFTSVWTTIKTFLSAAWGDIATTSSTVWNSITDGITQTWAKFTGWFEEKITGVKNLLASIADNPVFKWIVSGVQKVGAGISSAANHVVSAAKAGVQAAQDYTFGNSAVGAADGMQISRNAMGTDYWRGGLTWVGERGPEIVNLPRGSQVIPNHRLGDLVPSKGGETHNHFASGAVVVHAAPGQSPDEIAEAVLQKLGRKMRNQSYSRPRNVVRAW